jgi:hypothetical protein
MFKKSIKSIDLSKQEVKEVKEVKQTLSTVKQAGERECICGNVINLNTLKDGEVITCQCGTKHAW